ncbi:MAG: DUF4012 domain-containing protein [Ilumatobacteraceae bacterium]
MGAAPPDVASPYPVPVLAIVSIAAGFLVTAGQVHPTAYPTWDVLLVGVLAGLVVFVATEAPWWSLALVAVLTGATVAHSGQWPLVGVCVAALITALITARYWLPLVSAASAALSIGVLARLDDGHFFGSTAIIGLTLATLIMVTSMPYQSKVCRRVVWFGLSVMAVLMLIGGIGFGVAAVKASDAITRGNDAARRGISSLKAGDFDTAASLFDKAGTAYSDAQDQLATPWAKAGRLVPVVAQNRLTAMRVIDSAAGVVGRAETAASQIDPDALKVVNGAVDLAAVDALATPVDDLQAAIGDLQSTLAEPVSGWVPSQVTDRLATVRTDVDRYRTTVDNLSLAVHAAPGLLGSDRPRQYFVAFSTPAETRGIGGFIGNYAILTTDKGAISMSGFGRSDDLRLDAPADGMDITLPDDFARRYGPFNFVGANGQVEPMAWKNIGVSPDFPTMTDITTQMWKATYGNDIDGLILLDPFTVAQMLNYTGPQTIDGYDQPITSDNAADFILRTQYLVLPQTERVDALAQLAKQTIDSLLGGAMPSPMTAAKELGPLVQEHRLMMFTTDPAEQRMFDAVGLSGRFPLQTQKAAFAVNFQNAAPNKMDAYLAHQVTATQRTDDDLGIDVVDVTLTLTNTGKPDGLTDYVAGNSSGLPRGTIYDYLSVYGTVGVVDAVVDGKPLAIDTDQELGAVVASTYLELAPGQTAVLTFTFEAPGPEPAGGWTVFMAPMALPSTAVDG